MTVSTERAPTGAPTERNPIPVTTVQTRTARHENRFPRWLFKLISPIALVVLWQVLSSTEIGRAHV